MIPTVEVVRKRIGLIPYRDIRVCLMFSYLAAARVSEVVAHSSPADTSVARGPRGSDAYLTDYKVSGKRFDVVVFTLRTAKRGGLKRLVALPLNPNYEPWTKQVFDYFLDQGDDFVFPFTRQKVWNYAKEYFEGLNYPIERYSVTSEGIKKIVDRHERPFRTHALRHIRTTELIEFYGFDGVDLSIYGGWTLRSTIGVGTAVERYAHLQWRKYFPKLLKKRKIGDKFV